MRGGTLEWTALPGVLWVLWTWLCSPPRGQSQDGKCQQPAVSSQVCTRHTRNRQVVNTCLLPSIVETVGRQLKLLQGAPSVQMADMPDWLVFWYIWGSWMKRLFCSFLKGREAEEGDPDKRQLMDDLKVISLKQDFYLTDLCPAGAQWRVLWRRQWSRWRGSRGARWELESLELTEMWSDCSSNSEAWTLIGKFSVRSRQKMWPSRSHNSLCLHSWLANCAQLIAVVEPSASSVCNSVQWTLGGYRRPPDCCRVSLSTSNYQAVSADKLIKLTTNNLK